ncbi:MAG: 4-alpha-glucanotransferase [Thermodesulfovibrionales bacterium]
MQNIDELINELSELCGVIPEYWDIHGEKHLTTLETKIALLKAMRIKFDSEEDLLKEIHERKWKQWKNFIEPVHVISVNEQPMKIPIFIPMQKGEEKKLCVFWALESEDGQRDEFMISGDDLSFSEEQWINEERYIKIYLEDKVNRQCGYYEIYAECESSNIRINKGNSRVIITPDVCYIPPELHKRRSWGFSINLYSIRSSRNWGIGDFNDLKEIVKWTADLKGGFVGINPLHAIQNTRPFGISPYFPVSRLYKNFIYLDIEKIPEVFESDEAQAIIKSEPFKKEVERLRKRRLIDYEKIATLKKEILHHAFNLFYEKHYLQDTQRAKDFKKYLSEEGSSLESFSLFMTLWEHMMKAYHAYTWQQWFEYYRNPNSNTVQEFKKLHEKQILFNSYIQWLIDEQIKEINVLTKELGMVIGLYNDLAVGSVSGGSDTWNNQDIVGQADVGAPPDDFNPEGQNWGFPPLIPEKLKETRYEFFIQSIRKNMKYSGALRIDHAPGLFRLYWIPYGMSPKEGAYIKYPSEDLLRIIALESIRNKTVVIAEDLGTVAENVKESLKKFHMLSYKLFYFERNYPDPSFLPPERYPEMALCAVTTHDLPTLYGYWKYQDIKVRKKLGIYKEEGMFKKQVEERKRDKKLIISALKSQGIIPEKFLFQQKKRNQMTPELCLAVYKYLAMTPCKLLLVSFDDILGTLNQQNMPGTIDSYPNWIQKIEISIEEIIKDKRFFALSKMLKNYFLT